MNQLLFKFGARAMGASMMLAGSTVCAQTSPQPAADGVKLEEIIVTAERRESNVQKTAASVSVRSGEELAKQARYSLNQILEDVAGVSGLTSTGGSGGVVGVGTDAPETGIAIRGIRSTPGVTNSLPTAPAVASYVDGIYGGVGANYDIDRVEVLRGPQGTLYGRSATGGVIATHTHNPELGRWDGNLSAELGNYSLQHYTGAINVPLGDKLAVRASGNYYARDGYNQPKGFQDGGAVKNEDARIKMLYQATENLSVLAGYAMQDNTTHSGGVTYTLTGAGPDAYRNVAAPVGESKNQFRQYWADVNWNVGPMTVSYLAARRTWEQDGNTYITGPGGALFDNRQQMSDDSFVTHELHLTSNPGPRLAWQLGVLYYVNDLRGYRNESHWVSSNALLTTRLQNRKTTDTGVFAETTYSFVDTTRLTVGARYDTSSVATTLDYTANNNRLANSGQPNAGLPENNVSVSVRGNAGKADFSNITYKLRLEHDLSDKNLVYGMISTGFIPGDVQISPVIPTPVLYTYEAEELTAYEIGSKNRFLDATLQLNVALFYYRYKGYQQVVTPDASNPSIQFFLVTPARMQGGELEAIYKVTAHSQIGLNFGYVDPYWVDSPRGFSDSVAQKRIANIPPVKMALSYDYDFELPRGSNINLHADARYQSAYDIGAVSATLMSQGGEQYIHVSPKTVGNLALTWASSSKKYSVTGYVRNITDEVWKTSVTLQSATPVNATINTLSDPRTYGLMMGVNF